MSELYNDLVFHPDLSTLQTRLSSIDCELQRVKAQSAQQSTELDSLLDAYEKSVSLIAFAFGNIDVTDVTVFFF